MISSTFSAFAYEDAIIAVVNEELITLKDLKDYIRQTYVSLVAEGVDDTQIRTLMQDLEVDGTNKLIEDKLILSKANKVGIIVRESLIDERIEKMRKKYGSEQDLVNALIKEGATITDLRNKIRNQLKIKFIVDHEVKSNIYVNPQEVTNYYDKHKSQFMDNDRVNLQSIFIAYNDDKPGALMKAVDVFKYAAAENDFNTLVEVFSNAPSVGIVERGQFLPELEKVVFDLKIGEISPMIELNNGIYIFKSIGKIDAQSSPLQAVKDKIYDKIFMDKFKGQFMTWLDGLKSDAYIEIKE